MLASLALSLVLAAPPQASSAEAAAVREAHDRYRKALIAKDGPAAAAAVDGETIAYYAGIRDLVLGGDAAAVKKRPAVDKLMIVRLRHQVGRDAIEKMDGAGLFAFAVEQGWVDASSVQNAKLGAIRVEGDSATAELEVGGRVAPPAYSWRFKREGGVWRLSIVPLVRIAEPALQQAVKQSGLDEDAFVLALVEKISGEPVPASIWEPLRAPGKAAADGPAR